MVIIMRGCKRFRENKIVVGDVPLEKVQRERLSEIVRMTERERKRNRRGKRK